jgi:hypothetical protein
LTGSRQSSQPSLVNDSVQPDSINVPKARKRKKNARSEVWQHFEIFKDPQYNAWAYCSLCKSEVYYTDTMSTGMLTRHLRKHHREEYDNLLASEVKNKREKEKASVAEQLNIMTFVKYSPSYLIIVSLTLWCKPINLLEFVSIQHTEHCVRV